jgi:hypothetical protein
MAYDINAIKNKLKAMAGEDKADKVERPKLNWFKAEFGTVNIRFLPFTDSRTGEPFKSVLYYNSKRLSPYRLVSPSTFEMEDPILETLNELRSAGRQPLETWKFMRDIEPKERHYAFIVVRGREDEGAFVWEMPKKLVGDVYGHMAGEDLSEEDVTSPENGYDFVLTVTKADKLWEGRPVREYTITPRMKPSPLHTDAKVRKSLMSDLPDLEEYFKAGLKSKEALIEMFNAALSDKNETPSTRNKEVEHNAKDVDSSTEEFDSTTKDEIDSAFDDL